MDRKLVLEKLRAKALVDKAKRGDPRFLRTLGFLAAKKFLTTNIDVEERPTAKIALVDALWAARIEPRILEVLPAAVIKFPANFLLKEAAPAEFLEVIKNIRTNNNDGRDYNGIEFQKMKRWVDIRLPDRRTKPLNEMKIAKAYRLAPAIAAKLAKLAKQLNQSETKVLESAIRALRLPS